MKAYCTNCDKDVDYRVEKRSVLEFKNVKINSYENVAVCSECHHDIYISKLEDENIKPSYKTSAIIYSVLIKKSIELDELEKYLREYKNEEKNTEYNKLLVVYDYMRYGD